MSESTRKRSQSLSTPSIYPLSASISPSILQSGFERNSPPNFNLGLAKLDKLVNNNNNNVAIPSTATTSTASSTASSDGPLTPPNSPPMSSLLPKFDRTRHSSICEIGEFQDSAIDDSESDAFAGGARWGFGGAVNFGRSSSLSSRNSLPQSLPNNSASFAPLARVLSAGAIAPSTGSVDGLGLFRRLSIGLGTKVILIFHVRMTS